jgi:hypothetical protein
MANSEVLTNLSSNHLLISCILLYPSKGFVIESYDPRDLERVCEMCKSLTPPNCQPWSEEALSNIILYNMDESNHKRDFYAFGEPLDGVNVVYSIPEGDAMGLIQLHKVSFDEIKVGQVVLLKCLSQVGYHLPGYYMSYVVAKLHKKGKNKPSASGTLTGRQVFTSLHVLGVFTYA